MKTKPEYLIKAFQESENFPFGSRLIDFYLGLGFRKKDIYDLLDNGNVEVNHNEKDYRIGITREGEKEYVTIVSEQLIKLALPVKKLILGLKKQNARRW